MRQQNCNRLKFDNILPQLSLLDENAQPKVFISRIELLHDYKFLKIHYTNDYKIDEVEIEY